MNKQSSTSDINSQISFTAALLKTPGNWLALWISVASIIIQFVIFKYFYPYASYIYGDSFLYLEAAYNNSDINTYLIGYSKFLRLFSVFSSSDTMLVAFQYSLIQSSALFFLSTLIYFYRPSKAIQIFLLAFLVLNPLFLYMANMVSSDAIFLALSFIWFTLLLWIIHRPDTWLICWHALVLFIAFTVRYNALIYPFIAISAFLLSPLPLLKKVVGITAGFLLVGAFVCYTGNKYRSLTGRWQYAPFSGWQMANNAMYAYRYVDSASRESVPVRFKALDNMIRTYFDSSRDIQKHPIEALQASTFYMWERYLPLYQYRDLKFSKDSVSTDFRKWASMGPFYRSYGSLIIRKYPLHFARYYIWPNIKKYYAPPLEYLGVYNTKRDSVLPVARQWFGYKSAKIGTRFNQNNISMLDFYPILTGIMNMLFLFGLCCFIKQKGLATSTPFRKGVLFTTMLWLLNGGFSVFSTSAALRFLAFPILLTCTFSFLLMDWLWKALNMADMQTAQRESPYRKRIENA